MNIHITSHKDEVERELDKKISQILEMWGLVGERYAKDKTPVDTGRLRGSVTYATINSHSSGQSPAEESDYATHGTPERGEVVIGTNVEYAPYVELGTSRQKPQPYIRPAVADHLDEYSAIAQRVLQE